MCQWFAPTKLEITFETEGKGRFTAEDLQTAIVRDPAGEILYLNLPTKFALVSNHQVRKSLFVVHLLTESSRSMLTGGMHGV